MLMEKGRPQSGLNPQVLHLEVYTLLLDHRGYRTTNISTISYVSVLKLP